MLLLPYIQRHIAILKEMLKFDEIKSGNEQEIMKTLKKFEQANKEVEQYVYANIDDLFLPKNPEKKGKRVTKSIKRE
jgi:methyl-accepting chemotaxis protein